MPSFDDVARAVAGVPFMSPAQGRLVHDHIVRQGATRRAGTRHRARRRRRLHGRGGRARDDRRPRGRRATTPSPEEVAGPRRRRRPRRRSSREFSSYTWWLKERIAERSDAHGNVEPCFDFVYLDGAKNWTIDGLAVVLVEKLLRPGGWLLMDDLEWTYAQDPGREATDGIVHRELSERERTEPHLRAVFDLIVAQHPSFTELRRQDEWWGWARKAPGEPRRYTVETSRPLERARRRRGAQARSTRAPPSGIIEVVTGLHALRVSPGVHFAVR